MFFLCYYLRQQIKNYKTATDEEEKNKIARSFFDNDAEIFLEEMKKRH